MFECRLGTPSRKTGALAVSMLAKIRRKHFPMASLSGIFPDVPGCPATRSDEGFESHSLARDEGSQRGAFGPMSFEYEDAFQFDWAANTSPSADCAGASKRRM